MAAVTVPANVNVTIGTNATIVLSSAGSTCSAPNCTYLWTVQCPSAAPQTFTAPSPALVVGPGGAIDTSGKTSAFTCSAALVITDANGKTGNASAPVTIT